MKNILLKSLVVFVVMSFLNIQFIHWSGSLLQSPYKMVGGILYSILYLEFAIITIIGLVTILIFKQTYDSLFRIAILFEIMYLITLAISGINPFKYFITQNDLNLTGLLFYMNSFVVLLIMYFVHLIHSKIISSKN